MDSGHSQWRKLDNVALAFPAAAGKRDTRVFRFYCQLNREVDEGQLQQALDKTLQKYSLYQAVLRKGLFWYYLEHRNIRAEVKKENRPPCSKLYIPDEKSLLFDVSYYKNRINLEVFHALTDGTGAMNFLKELVKNYLVLAHPDKKFTELGVEDITGKDQAEDSFSQYYSKDLPKERQKIKLAYQLKGEHLEQDDMEITEILLSVDDVLKKARGYGVSVTVLLTAMLIWSIHLEVPARKMKSPVSLMVPVNLRNYFPSQSMSNFFGWLEVGYEFEKNTIFEDVLNHVKKLFKKELVKERIGMRMNGLVQLEKNPFLRAVQLDIKNLFLMAGTALGGRNVTAVYSNLGIVKMPEEYEAYIDRFGVFTSTGIFQLCSCSYGNQLALGFTSKFLNTNIQRDFMNVLKENSIDFKIEENDFPGYLQKPKTAVKKILQVFTFVCIAVSVICCMINYMISDSVSWAIFVTAGCFCTWLVVNVAYYKRRNLLKNSMWQLLILTGIGILWDIFTGWHGWSIDFILPLASLVVLCSMPIIAKVQRLESAEYLFYLIQASAFGIIPLILLLCHAVSIQYPSVICVGVSVLFFVGLWLFRFKEVKREVHKKFRI